MSNVGFQVARTLRFSGAKPKLFRAFCPRALCATDVMGWEWGAALLR